jgi:hypothetical protein
MFAEYRKAVSLLQIGTVSLKSTSISKSYRKRPDFHMNDNTPVDEECYDGTVVDGTIVWKPCNS